MGLVATANAALTMETYTTIFPQCQSYADVCDADAAWCKAIDQAVHENCMVPQWDEAALAMGITRDELLATAPAAPLAQMTGTGYAACSFMMTKYVDITAKVPYSLSSLYDCQFTNLAGLTGESTFNWNAVSGTWMALEICMDNPDCVDDWEGVISQTSKLDVKWDDTYEPILGFEFPNTDQDSKNFCLILFGVMAYANTDLLHFGSAMFALQMENGGEIVEECNALMQSRVIGLVCGISAGVSSLLLLESVHTVTSANQTKINK